MNTADYNVWLSNNGKTVPLYTGADGNGDAKVNSSDYAIWAANVPEPGSSMLVSFALLFGASVQRAVGRQDAEIERCWHSAGRASRHSEPSAGAVFRQIAERQ